MCEFKYADKFVLEDHTKTHMGNSYIKGPTCICKGNEHHIIDIHMANHTAKILLKVLNVSIQEKINHSYRTYGITY